jgi:hypothetical protein
MEMVQYPLEKKERRKCCQLGAGPERNSGISCAICGWPHSGLVYLVAMEGISHLFPLAEGRRDQPHKLL